MTFPDSDLEVIIEAFLGADPTADPGTWPAATDLSARLLERPINITRGRRQNQRTAAAGTCTFWLDNDDGALTPLLATSPYYPEWDLGVPMRLSVDGVGVSPPYPQFSGFVVDITADMQPGVAGQNLSVVKVTLGGVLRRLGQGSVEKSAMYRAFELGALSVDLLAWWPLESGDERQVDLFSSPLPGVQDANSRAPVNPVVLGAFASSGGVHPGPAGAASATSLNNALLRGGDISAIVDHSQPFRFGASILLGSEFTVNAFGQPEASLITIAGPSGGYERWRVSYLFDSPNWIVVTDRFDSAATPTNLANTTYELSASWHLITLTLSPDSGGANTAWETSVDGAVIASGVAAGLTYSTLAIFRCNVAQDWGGVIATAHMGVWNGSSLPSLADTYSAFTGHAGEQAHERFERLCLEEGIPYSLTATTSHEVGAQPVGDILAALRDLETVDHGILSELLSTWGLGYRSGGERYNLSPAMTIDLSTYRTTSGTSADVLRPIRNDARIRNEWTISAPDGAEATALDAAHQAKRGRYFDSATVNVSTSGQLPYEAQWRVREGTDGGMRYAAIPIDLGANASTLLPDWLEMQLGDRFDRTNHLDQHPADAVLLEVEGYTVSLRHRGGSVNLVVEPYEPWRVQQLSETPPDDDLLDGWLIPDTMTVDGSDFDAGIDTSMDVAVSPEISTSADEMPLRIRALGVLLEVTAVGAPSAGVQTLTVTQTPLNGVTKTIPAGSTAELEDPIVASL